MLMGLKKRLIGVWVLCLLFSACGCRQSVSTIALTSTPVVLPTAAAITPAPLLENPVGGFWHPFYARYTYCQSLLDNSIAGGKEVESLGEVLAVRQLMQRLQYLFLPPSNLPQGESEDAWEGVLLGAFHGSGSIYGDDVSCLFSCTLREEGKLVGALNNNRLTCAWRDADVMIQTESGEEEQMEGALRCNAQIVQLDEEGYHVSLFWEENYYALRILQDAIWFQRNAETWIEADMPPEQWAAWCYIEGAYVYYTQQSDEENDSAEENAA